MSRARWPAVMIGALALVSGREARAQGYESEATKSGRYRALHLLCLALEDAALSVGDGPARAAAVGAARKAFVATLAAPPPPAVRADLDGLAAAEGSLRLGTSSAGLTKRLQALSARLQTDLAVDLAPTRTPDRKSAAALYAEHCASCHGASGDADGTLAPKIHPPLASFHAARMDHVAPFHVYNVLLVGRDGTAMPAFAGQLSEQGLWGLAYFVVGLRHPVAEWTALPAAWQHRLGAAGLSLTLLCRLGDAELSVWAAAALHDETSFSQGRDMPTVLAALRGSAPYLKTLSRQ